MKQQVGQAELLAIYDRLFRWRGPRHWWPAETPFEVVVGAILTQNVAWSNVEKAIRNLREAGLLTPEAMHAAPADVLEPLIRSTGYYHSKARKLKAFCTYLFEQAGGSLDPLFDRPLASLRPSLLAVYGVGPETGDAILCYAGNQPIMVMDAYTRRVFSRLGLTAEDASYESLQEFFMSRLPGDVQLFNEYHALIDGLANELCLKRSPRCGECPLLELCPTGQAPVPAGASPPAAGARKKAASAAGRRGKGEAQRVPAGAGHL